MAAFNYPGFAKTGLSLLVKTGVAGCTLTRPGSAAASDPSTPWRPDATADAVLATGLHVVRTSALESYEDGGAAAADLTPGSTAVLFVSPLELGGVTPMLNDVVAFGSDVYSVLRAVPYAPGGVMVLWSLHCGN